MTLIAATIIEVCSEGSTPIAAEILIVLEVLKCICVFDGGVSTDYTEIMALKEQTRSWKIALFLPLVTFTTGHCFGPHIKLECLIWGKVKLTIWSALVRILRSERLLPILKLVSLIFFRVSVIGFF